MFDVEATLKSVKLAILEQQESQIVFASSQPWLEGGEGGGCFFFIFYKNVIYVCSSGSFHINDNKLPNNRKIKHNKDLSPNYRNTKKHHP